MGPSASFLTSSLSKPRLGENAPPPLRSPRLRQKNGFWYFNTREGVELGPYFSPEESEKAVAEFVRFAEKLSSPVVKDFIRYQQSKINQRLERKEFPCRQGEIKPAPARSKRIFESDNCWYFRTRERTNIGPYRTPEQAGHAATQFVRFASRLTDTQVQHLIQLCLHELDRVNGLDSRRPSRLENNNPLAQRSDRVVRQADGWYVLLRQTTPLGPFQSSLYARALAKRLEQLMNQIPARRLDALIARVRSDAQTLTDMPVLTETETPHRAE